MKTLSIRQPHAHAIIHGVEQTDGSRLFKPVENRSWATNLRGRIAIHASQFNPKELREAREFWEDRGILGVWPKDLVYGAVIGTVEVYGCVTEFDSPFFVGPYGFLLRNPIPIEPVFVPGHLGFWNWEPPR
jgi:hypothetical protein